VPLDRLNGNGGESELLGMLDELVSEPSPVGNRIEPTDAPKKGPGRPKKASADAAGANVEDAAGDAPRAKRRAAK
jgi:hypothetical protein